MNPLESSFPTTECIVSDGPLIIRRGVRWSDCDPARIVFTPRFLDYAVSAHEAVVGMMIGRPNHSRKNAFGVDSSVRGAALDFRAPLALGATFDMEVRTGEIRIQTFDIYPYAWEHANHARIAFGSRITPITVDRNSRKAVSMPVALRRQIAKCAAKHPFQPEDVQ